MQKLRTAHMKEVMPLKNQLNELEAHLKTLTTGTNPDMNVIYAEIEKMGKIKTDLQKMKAKHHQDVRKLLTDEQRVMFDMHSGKGFGKHGKGFGQGQGPGMHCGGNPMNK
jgi:Spy/CpxP family protein refolding chaperone